MKNKALVKFIYLVLLSAIIVCFYQGQVKAQQMSALKIGLYISDDRILIYSGADKHLTIGLKLNVVRSKGVVATVEIVDVRASFSVARVLSKIDEIADGDELYYPSAMPNGAKSGGDAIGTDKTAPIGGKTADTKATETAKKPAVAADKKKDTAKPATSARRDAVVAGKESPEDSEGDKKTEKPAEKAKTTTPAKAASKSDTAKKDTQTADKKDAKAGDKKDAKAGGGKDEKAGGKDSKVAAAQQVSKSYPTEFGFSGLWTVPTAEVASAGKTGFSLYRSAHSYSSNGTSNTEGGTLTSNYFDSRITQTYSVNYGIGRGMEATFAHSKEDYNLSEIPINSFSFESDIIGVKYQLKKKLLLDEATKKQWVYAIGAVKQSYGLLTKGGDKVTGRGSVVYGVVSAPVDSFFVHLSVAYVKNNGAQGRKTSSSAGVEIPLSSNVSLLGEADLFQAEYSYNTALRFSSSREKQNMAFLLGYGDITGQRDKSLGFSLKY